MIASMLWLGTAVLGAFFPMVHHMYPTLSFQECAWIAAPLGVTLATWISALHAWAVGTVSEDSVQFSIVFFSVLAVIEMVPAVRKMYQCADQIFFELKQSLGVHVLLVFGSIYAMSSTFSHYAAPTRDGKTVYTSGACYGDLAFHLNVVHSFVNGCNDHGNLAKLVSPIFADSRLVYPFIPDYSASLLLLGGMTLQEAMAWPQVIVMVSLFGLMYSLALRLTRNRSAAVLSVALVVLSSGIMGFKYVASDANWLSLDADVTQTDPTTKEDVFWFHFLVHVLLPQRTAAYAYAMVCSAVVCILATVLPFHSHHALKQLFTLAGVCVGLTPMLQAHAFLGVLVLLATYCVLNVHRMFQWSYLKHWLQFAIPVLVLGLPQVAMYMQRASSSGFVSITPAWGEGSSLVGIARFWFHALGALVFLHVPALFIIPGAERRKMYIGFMAVFLFGSYVKLQPWHKDNVKIFNVWLFGAAAGVAALLDRARTRVKHVGPLLYVALVLSLTFSGALMLGREAGMKHHYYGEAEQELATYINHNTRADGVFLVANDHRAVPAMLAGRQLFAGYDGWLWSHGIDYHARDKLRKELLSMHGNNSKQGLAKLKKNNIHFVLGTTSDKAFNRDWYDSNAKLVYERDHFRLYQTLH